MPGRWFASDNNAAAHPRVMEALVRANDGHAVGYGDDPLTATAEAAVGSLFGPGAVVRFVLNGTGANVYALGCFAGQGDAILCSDCAHILVDETGAPTSVLGSQLVPLETRDGKIVAGSLVETIRLYDDMHKPRPAALSLSQPTEVGTVYSPAEIAELARVAHGVGLAVHVDGARLSNAAAALGLGPAEASGYRTTDGSRGIDAVCFGGTKNGLMFGEAVIFSPAADLPDTARLRKTRLQLASKMRYIAAQFDEYLRDGLWRDCAEAANRRAAALAAGLVDRGYPPEYPVETNGVFVRLPPAVVETLRRKRFFYDWEGGAVRWMASWDTSDDDVAGMLADLDEALSGAGLRGAGQPSRSGAGAGAIVEPPEATAEKAAAMAEGRRLLLSNWDRVDALRSPESLGLPAPPFVIPAPDGAALVALPDPLASGLGGRSFADCQASRRSRRKYLPEPLSLDELSFMVWSCAGVKSIKNGNAFRVVPSGGCRHPLDLIVYARRVDGLAPGLYRHMATDRSLALLRPASVVPGADPERNGFLSLDGEMDAALSGQLWNCAAAFVWTAVPYRTEWRYTVAAAKTLLLDAGHACQALYGACEALGLGICAQAAYDQEKLDAALGVDGVDEAAVYVASIGRVAAR
ncbi:MAG TPA: beta-eliminating lyase-related protein [Spirochaetia bacterium]|nr:beta-eliminating lyase-related protein [Spirochaetia bacterium]